MFTGKPDAGNPQVRFDEGEQRDWQQPPVALYSTVHLRLDFLHHPEKPRKLSYSGSRGCSLWV